MKTAFKGQLKRWNDDKGFGFIKTDNESKDIFIHISALKGMSRRPTVGDIIYYQIHNDNSGKSKAINAKIEGVTEIRKQNSRKNIITRKSKNKSKQSSIFVIFLLVLGIFAFYNKNTIKNIIIEAKSSLSTYPLPKTKEKSAEYEEIDYSCDGKVYCSEMTSCEEAEFYLKNCPETKIDGDGDGIPCESQWCNDSW
ncbi:MAG: cold shock domain-containing protein [Desulfobacterales bacterium]|nr:cold shock domain-containing protein [Desulfobacterales bacterium]